MSRIYTRIAQIVKRGGGEVSKEDWVSADAISEAEVRRIFMRTHKYLGYSLRFMRSHKNWQNVLK